MEMNDFDKYQEVACSLKVSTVDPLYCILGLAGEVGEVYSLFAKGRRDGFKPDFQLNLKKELGDCLWFISQIALDNNIMLSDAADSNLAKLIDRQKRGVLQGSGDNR